MRYPQTRHEDTEAPSGLMLLMVDGAEQWVKVYGECVGGWELSDDEVWDGYDDYLE